MTNTHSTAQVVPFNFDGISVRAFSADGQEWLYAPDVTKALALRDTTSALKMVDLEDKRTFRRSEGPHFPEGLDNRVHEFTAVNESGMYALVFQSNKPEAKRFRRWVTNDVLPQIRKTGRYGTVEMSREELLSRAFVEATKAIEEFKAKAESGERFKREIEAGDGLTLREFHKKYFSEITETEFMEHLYNRAYLINQLGKGSRRTSGPKAGTRRDGSQHRHPTYKGKEFFYLHCAGIHGGKRRETTRVRPGEWEIALRDKLSIEGLAANENAHALFAIENSATKELQ